MLVYIQYNFNSNISLKKYSVRSNININLTKTTEAIIRVNGSFDDYRGPIDGGDALYNKVMKTSPVLFPKSFPNVGEYTNNTHLMFGNYGDYKGTHDIGFMMNCSYGNAYRLAPADSVRQALVQTSDNLCSRFDPTIGSIRSWDFGKWNFPVIIDNMMNLDLLFYVSHLTNDSKYKDIALKHAETTLKNHFRTDHSSYHVVSYNNDGSVEMKCTHQGKNDDSSWARGQAWGVYGYTSCYRESKDTAFLQQAKDIATLIMTRVKTEDAIPLWDYDAPDSPETPRDASAASVTASALIELSTLVEDGQVYFDYAEKLLKSLSSDAYLAKVGTNQGFILMHSTGSLPNGSEIDTPINYADYYYLEALARYMQVKGLGWMEFAGFILCPLGTSYVCGYLLFSVSIREGSLEQTDAFGPEIVH